MGFFDDLQENCKKVNRTVDRWNNRDTIRDPDSVYHKNKRGKKRPPPPPQEEEEDELVRDEDEGDGGAGTLLALAVAVAKNLRS